MTVKILNGTVLATLLLTCGGIGSGAMAQSLAQIGGPANTPPASFQGQQFVDSRGCLFLRAGYGKNVNWVARVDRNHKPICSMTPTGGATAQAAVAADMAPDPQAVTQPQTAQTQMVQTQSVQTQPQTAPAPKAQGNLFAFLAPTQNYVAPSPGPRPTVVPMTAAPTVPAANVTPMAAPVMMTAPVQTAAVQMTYVQVVAPPQPVAMQTRTLPKPPKGWTYAWKDDRLNPLRGIGTAQGQAQQDMVWQRTIPMVLVGDPLPQTAFQRALGIHPKVKVARQAAPVAAYGLRTTVSTMSATPEAQPAPQVAPVVQVAATPAAPQAAGGLRIQVGCFGDPANAQGTVARLAQLGLPVFTANITRNGKALQIVYAGPFGNGADASSGLTTVHGAGFGDAFLR